MIWILLLFSFFGDPNPATLDAASPVIVIDGGIYKPKKPVVPERPYHSPKGRLFPER